MKIWLLLFVGVFGLTDIIGGNPEEDVDKDNSDFNRIVSDMTFPDTKDLANEIKEQKLSDYFNKINSWTNMIN